MLGLRRKPQGWDSYLAQGVGGAREAPPPPPWEAPRRGRKTRAKGNPNDINYLHWIARERRVPIYPDLRAGEVQACIPGRRRGGRRTVSIQAISTVSHETRTAYHIGDHTAYH